VFTIKIPPTDYKNKMAGHHVPPFYIKPNKKN